MDKIEESLKRGKDTAIHQEVSALEVALLTGGGDRPYVYGLAKELLARGVRLDLIGSDDLDFPDLRREANLNFLNLRGSNLAAASVGSKVARILRYYLRLFGYAATARPRIFHILWNNKFQTIDRTLLMFYYKLLGKNILLTVHNVNAARRDQRDSALNRLTLRAQYRMTDRLFVHTDKMRRELIEEFGVQDEKVVTIPFGINNSIPVTGVTSRKARERLTIPADRQVILFFGNIKPYKGVDILLAAFQRLMGQSHSCHLLIAGRPDDCDAYWKRIQFSAQQGVDQGRIQLHGDFIPDESVELYFKAADVLVLPYRHIYQSGVLFLAHSFGLPVIAANVGSLADDIVEGENGLICEPESPDDLAKKLDDYFQSRLYSDLESRRMLIREDTNRRHSWTIVGQRTLDAYAHATGASAKQDLENVASSLYALEGKLASTDERKN